MTPQRMTVCYADIARFNMATRNMSLDQLAGFVQGFYECVGEVLLAHGGRLVKYIGDAVLMAFDEGREEIAARAMWTVRQRYREYATAAGPDAAVTSLRIGIATGEVVAGRMGHPDMLAYNVVGRPMTLAMALAKTDAIAVDEATHEALGDRVAVEPADLRGEVRSYRVIGFR